MIGRGVLLLSAAVVASSVGHADGQRLIPRDEVLRIGLRAAAALMQPGSVDGAAEDARRLNRVGARLLATRESGERSLSIRLLDSPDVDAAAVPSVGVFVTRGMTERLRDDDDALAAVIGHALAHLDREHVRAALSRRLRASTPFRLVARITGPDEDNATAVADIMSPGFSIGEETEADEVAAIYLHRAGFDVAGLPRALAALAQGHLERRPVAWLSRHPGRPKRVEAAEKIVERRDYAR